MPSSEQRIGLLLRKLEYTLSLAESCTGGLVSHRITNVVGSSDYYLGGVNAYSNQAKMDLLGVMAGTLKKFGAVSSETVIEMACGANRVLKTDWSLAISGIAGPGGGTVDKPVGLVWIAIGQGDQAHSEQFRLSGSRLEIKNQSAELALFHLLSALEAVARQREIKFEHASSWEPLPVNFSIDSDGSHHPHSLHWLSKTWPIESTGRSWTDELGWHVLVMIAGQNVTELVVNQDGCWFIKTPVRAGYA